MSAESTKCVWCVTFYRWHSNNSPPIFHDVYKLQNSNPPTSYPLFPGGSILQPKPHATWGELLLHWCRYKCELGQNPRWAGKRIIISFFCGKLDSTNIKLIKDQVKTPNNKPLQVIRYIESKVFLNLFQDTDGLPKQWTFFRSKSFSSELWALHLITCGRIVTAIRARSRCKTLESVSQQPGVV